MQESINIKVKVMKMKMKMMKMKMKMVKTLEEMQNMYQPLGAKWQSRAMQPAEK